MIIELWCSGNKISVLNKKRRPESSWGFLMEINRKQRKRVYKEIKRKG